MEHILINKLQNIVKTSHGSVADSISAVLLKNLNHIKSKTIIQVASEANCSKASVVKFAKRLGLDGYKELIQRLNMEASVLVPQLTLVKPTDGHPKEEVLLDRYHSLIRENLDYIHNNFSNEIVKVVEQIKKKPKIFLFGKGANLNALQVFSNYLIKLDHWVNFSVDLDIQNTYVENVQANDLCFIFSYSGLTSEMTDIYDTLKEKQAKIVLVTSNQFSPMYSMQNINLFVLKNEEVQKLQRNSLLSLMFIIMQIVYLLSN